MEHTIKKPKYRELDRHELLHNKHVAFQRLQGSRGNSRQRRRGRLMLERIDNQIKNL